MEEENEKSKRSLRALGALNKIWDTSSDSISDGTAQSDPDRFEENHSNKLPAKTAEGSTVEQMADRSSAPIKKDKSFWEDAFEESSLQKKEPVSSKIPAGVSGADFFGTPQEEASAVQLRYQWERPDASEDPMVQAAEQVPDKEEPLTEREQEISALETEKSPKEKGSEESAPKEARASTPSGSPVKKKMTKEEKKAYWDSLSLEEKRRLRAKHKEKQRRALEEQSRRNKKLGGVVPFVSSVLRALSKGKKKDHSSTQGTLDTTGQITGAAANKKVVSENKAEKRSEPLVQKESFKLRNPILYKTLMGIGVLGAVCSVLVLYLGYVGYQVERYTPGSALYVKEYAKKEQLEKAQFEERLKNLVDEEGNPISAPSPEQLAILQSKSPQELLSLSEFSSGEDQRMQQVLLFEQQRTVWEKYNECKQSVIARYSAQMERLLSGGSVSSVVQVRGALNYETARCALLESNDALLLGALDFQSMVELGTAMGIAQADALRLNALNENIKSASVRVRSLMEQKLTAQLSLLREPYVQQIAWCERPLGMYVCRYKFMASDDLISAYGSGWQVSEPIAKKGQAVIWQLENAQEYGAFMQQVEESLLKNERPPSAPWESPVQ